MKDPQARFGAGRSVLLAVLAASLASAGGCQFSEKERVVPTKWSPFIQQARQAQCADIRNRLFVIDQALVFADRRGNCADAMYSEVLYGGTIDDVLCFEQDSFGGPHYGCPDPSYKPMFDWILAHLDEPDLGLEPAHTVQQLQF